MPVATLIKDKLDKLPFGIGQVLSYMPYPVRPGVGKIYSYRKREIRLFEKFDSEQKKEFIFKRIHDLISFALENVPFYQKYYSGYGFRIEDLKSFDDIQMIPIINRSILQQYSIDDRTSKVKDKYLVNTGGSSGKPLSFFIQSTSLGHELAHMHTVWEKLGYRTFHLKLVFGGRSNIKNLLQYDSVRHHFAVDIYAEWKAVSEKSKKILKRKEIFYLHGYPSAIYEFAIYCEEDIELLELLKRDLKGVFLGSEFPALFFRDKIESVFKVRSVSWYGHTERAVLAYEKQEPFLYFPFQTYGYTEAVENDENKFNLVGTSYYNFASPFIRYNAEDEINDLSFRDGLLESFRIDGGRRGELILDKKGKAIPLTGLIFGRHHKLFDYCTHLQVMQDKQGFATILYVLDDKREKVNNVADLFDSNNVEIEFNFKQIKYPIKTSSGKINLLIKKQQFTEE